MIVTVTKSEDCKETETDTESGIAGYSYRLNGGEWTEWTTDTTHKFDNIYGDFTGVQCTVEVKVRDNSGNEIQNPVTKVGKTNCYNATYCKRINSGVIGKLTNQGGATWTLSSNTSCYCLVAFLYTPWGQGFITIAASKDRFNDNVVRNEWKL